MCVCGEKENIIVIVGLSEGIWGGVRRKENDRE
jgi:hypothetical protein